MKTKLFTFIALSLLAANGAFADTCPGTDGVFAYSGSLTDDWLNSTQETITSGDHNLLQVTWKPEAGSKGTIYCTYSGSLVLASKNTAIEKPSSVNWNPSSIKDAFNCVKGMKDCEF